MFDYKNPFKNAIDTADDIEDGAYPTEEMVDATRRGVKSPKTPDWEDAEWDKITAAHAAQANAATLDTAQESPEDVKDRIYRKIDGFEYMKKGITLLCEDPVLLITKGVYPEIGECYNPPVSNAQVEQSIRSAINDAWEQRNKRVWGYYFPNATGRDPKKPTNAEFITRIARILELWQCCQKEVSYETK